ncbi:MAG TPA: hypothetical protein VMH35_14855 [Streptosporangiaceae bacterium]|nr:hypothetical protein [Streptosporangiaceae bacterium]
MAFRHPLAFLLRLEGAVLLRAHAGDHYGRAFVEARLAGTQPCWTTPPRRWGPESRSAS